MCGPQGLKPGAESACGITSRRPGQIRFVDVSKKAGIETPGPRYGLSVTTLDYDRDGWSDIYVAVDSQASLLYHNKHDGTFRRDSARKRRRAQRRRSRAGRHGHGGGRLRRRRLAGPGEDELHRRLAEPVSQQSRWNFFRELRCRRASASTRSFWVGARPLSITTTMGGRTFSW